MIKIEKLTKIYKAKARTSCRALDEISLVLPDKGMVFVLGKSGSGKSTLLNLIGGLDSFDGGDIISFGHSLASFQSRDFEAYRSDFVSFIFQDFHLIDELTVLENITLFNSDNINDELLSATLCTVGLEEYVNRYPEELSGGQKQRVAIARGIMKEPRVILCDEPTGNLDRGTSRQILELLKEISKDKLVVIVSHNLSEAQMFADRIIELADGKVIDDITRDAEYKNDFLIENGRATLPYNKNLSPVELEMLNSAIAEGEVTSIDIRPSGFEKSDVEYKQNKIPLILRRLGAKNVLRLFKKFFFSKYKAAICTVLLSILMFGLFAISQSFTKFNAVVALEDSLEKENSIVAIEKDYKVHPMNIYDDLSVLGQECAYPVYNQTIWINSEKYGNSWDSKTRMSDESNFSDLFIHENYGLMITDEEYLLDLFGKDGEIKLLKGSLEDAYGTGVLITDYFADSIIKHEIDRKSVKYLTYDKIVGVFTPSNVNNACRIAGIIDTDYEERYEDVFSTYEEYVKSNKDPDVKEIKAIVSENPLYMDFVNDVKIHLGISYSFNKNFIEDFNIEETSLVKCMDMYFAAGDSEVFGSGLNYMSTMTSPLGINDVAKGEIGLPYSIYNDLFGTSYNDNDANKLNHVEEREVKIRRYVDDDPECELLYEMTFTVKFLTATRLVASVDDMIAIRQADWQPSRIYIKNPGNLGAILEFAHENGYHFVSATQQNMKKLDEIITTFHDLFKLLEMTTVGLILFYLITFGIKSIRQNSYQIGVIKALGGRTRDISKIFILKTFIIGVVIAVLSVICSIGIIELANRILVESIEKVVGVYLNDLVIIKVHGEVLLVDALVIVCVSLVSSLIPTLLLKRIKPVAIIKAKE